jgi:hypothetical protein
MTDAERDRIMRTAHETLERLRDLPPVQACDPAAHATPEQWRRSMPPQPEPPKRERKLDTADVDWDARIAAAISREHELLMDIIAQAFRKTFKVERDAIAAALAARDKRIIELENERHAAVADQTKSTDQQIEQLKFALCAATAEQFKQHERMIAKLEHTIAKLECELAKTQVKFIEKEIAREKEEIKNSVQSINRNLN